MSDTPRTDAFRKRVFDAYCEWYHCDSKTSYLYLDLVPSCKMEEIELELTAANARVLQLEVALDAIRLKVLFQSSAYAREVFEIANNLLENKHEPNP